MEYYSSHINKLIEQLSHLPGIGAKSAQRLAFHIVNMPKDQVEQLTSSITGARENVQYCKCCCTLTDREICPICSNDKRDHSVIMVVENTRDLAAYEKTGKFDGVYHVLHGAFSGDFALESGISFYSHSSVLLSQRLLCRTPPFSFLSFAASEDALDHSLVSLSRSIFHSDTTYV